LVEAVGEKIAKIVLKIVEVDSVGVSAHHPMNELSHIAVIVILLAVRGYPGALSDLLLETASTLRHKFGGVIFGVASYEWFHQVPPEGFRV
jgi:hypothetical protein